MCIGVGLAGAGSVARGIHVPTLSRLNDRFRLTHVMDPDEASGQELASKLGARASGSLDALLADAAVDVVAVCGPDHVHADQVIAACAAGKRAVLCEKPLATTADEATAIARAAQASGTHVVVGAMHVYDPAWLAVARECDDLRRQATLIRSSIVLPFNERYENWSTEPLTRPPAAPALLATAAQRAARLRLRILALSIHDLPLVRSFVPEWSDSTVAATGLLDPVGYFVTMHCGDRLLELVGSFRDHWRPRWELDVLAEQSSLHLKFPPSYVHAGSANATLVRGSSRQMYGHTERDGYENEWLHIHRLLTTGAPPQSADLDGIVDDLRFAVRIADLAHDALAAG